MIKAVRPGISWGDAIVVLRRAHGLSVEQLAAAARLEPAAVEALERGDGATSDRFRVLDALGYPARWADRRDPLTDAAVIRAIVEGHPATWATATGGHA